MLSVFQIRDEADTESTEISEISLSVLQFFASFAYGEANHIRHEPISDPRGTAIRLFSAGIEKLAKMKAGLMTNIDLHKALCNNNYGTET